MSERKVSSGRDAFACFQDMKFSLNGSESAYIGLYIVKIRVVGTDRTPLAMTSPKTLYNLGWYFLCAYKFLLPYLD